MDKDVMTRPPRRAKDPMITLPLIAQVVGAAAMIVMGTLFVFQREVGVFIECTVAAKLAKVTP